MCACILNFDENSVLYFPLFVQMCSNALREHCIVALDPLNRACTLAIDSTNETRL